MTNLEPKGKTYTHDMYELLVRWNHIPNDKEDDPSSETEYELVKSEIAKYETFANLMYGDRESTTHRTRALGQVGFLRLAMNAETDGVLEREIRDNKWKSEKSIDDRIYEMIKSYSNLAKKAKKVEADGVPIDMNGIDFADVESQLNDGQVADLRETIYSLIEDDSSTMTPALGGQLQLLFGKRRPPVGVSPGVLRTAVQQAAAQLRNKLTNTKLSSPEEHVQYGIRYLSDVLGYSYETMQSINTLVQRELFLQGEDSTLTAEAIQDVIERCIASAFESLYKE